MMQPQQKQDDAETMRAHQRRAFVDTTAFTGSGVMPLRVDASIRRFFRVEKNGRTAVLMDARPPMEDTAKFALMREKLGRLGFSVPEIYAADHTLGLVLMEDFGDERYFELVSGGKEDMRKLYNLAVDALVHKFFADPKIALNQSVAYSDDYWLFRVEQFLEHYFPHVLKRQATTGERADFLGLYREAITAAHRFDPVLLHGDYGVQNLYYLPQRPGIKALGLIDFQDMTDARGNMMGSPAFDLVFLIQDVRFELPAGMEAALYQRFVDKTGIGDTRDFASVYATIGTAQSTKCLGLFAKLGYGAGRQEYLPFLDICWRNIARNLKHPDLAGIAGWFEKNGIEVGK